jgi:hypothetical protein
MQLDPAFAARVFAGEDEALRSLALAPEDLELLRALDPAAVGADLDDQRKRQLLGNLAGEYGLSLAAGPEDLLAGFLGSPEFHGAVARGEHLALAFGDYSGRRAREEERGNLRALCALERAMALLRRRRAPPPRPAAGVVRLSHRASLVELPDGTLAFAARLRDALERRRSQPGMLVSPGGSPGAPETVLLFAEEAPRHALPSVRPERLSTPVARLLEGAEGGLSPAGRALLAVELGADPEELEAFAAELVAEGVLVAG